MAEKQLGLSDVTIKGIWFWMSGADPYDLVPHLRELNIYESIYSNSLTGNITLDEALNLPAKFPIVGEEMIQIDIDIPGMSDSIDRPNPLWMHIHKISNHKLKGPQSVEYSLELVSEQYMNNIHARVSKSYNDKKTYQIAREIHFNYLQTNLRRSTFGTFEPTDRIEPCVIPNWTPYQAINWLARRSNSLKNPKAANYIYYESITGSNFVSIDSLVKGKSSLLFSLEPAHVDPHKVQYFEYGTVKCDSIDIVEEFEMIKDINNGCYASKLITHDIVTKKIFQHDYDLSNSWNDTHHLSKQPPITFVQLLLRKNDNNTFAPSPTGKSPKLKGSRLSDCTDSAVMFAPKHNQMFSSKPDHEYDNRVEDWKLQRKSQLTLLEGIKFVIQAGAMPFLRVGMCADIHIMSPESYVKHDSFEDKKMSGKCLVTAVRHIISLQAGNPEYKVQIELVKDGIDYE